MVIFTSYKQIKMLKYYLTVHLSLGKFKPVIKKAMVELDGKFSYRIFTFYLLSRGV